MTDLFSCAGKTAVITGGSGVLGFAMAQALGSAGAKIALIARDEEKLNEKTEDLRKQGFSATYVAASVTSKEELLEAKAKVKKDLGGVDILVNSAGGNMSGATISHDQNFFDLDIDAYRNVVDLNLVGSVLPSMVFGEDMAEKKKGSIVNISSMTASKPISRVLGYGNSKAAIDNFTKWLSTELIAKYGEGIRVNAIAPGFFLTEQNRSLLTNPDGSYTDRAKAILSNTPFNRFGKPEELGGTLVWLCSDASSFVTGVVVPVDGGFSSYGGL